MLPSNTFAASSGTDLEAYLSELQPGTVLLDTSQPGEENRGSLLFANPAEVISAAHLAEVPDALTAIDQAVAGGRYVAGFISYEAAYAMEPQIFREMETDGSPLLWMGVYDEPHALSDSDVGATLRSWAQQEVHLRDVKFGISRERYLEKIARVKELIREGEVYQINFTDRITADVEGPVLSLYARLRQAQPVAYGALLQTDTSTILSFSPELFFRREGRRVWTRPMKGTIRRGRTVEEDDELARMLREDAKSQAENLMIVDLLRNDLSVCCEPGSVRVPELFSIERYRSVTQLTSTVEGRLKRSSSYNALFRALFPCGSVTGAPKLRAMEHIASLEEEPRGVYCGAIGYISPEDRAVFSVAIRTLSLKDGRATMGTGSGIVWDSNADEEYDECLLKAEFLKGAGDVETHEPLQLIETMRCEDGEIALLDRHIARMNESAAYFNIPFREQDLRDLIYEEMPSGSTEPHLMRVVLAEDGALNLTVRPLPGDAFRTVCIVNERINPDEVFRYHKTNRRGVYRRALEQANARGCDEPILLNTRGEVCEGARTNVFVKHDGTLFTPPISSGLLPGVYRSHVLETKSNVREKVLHPEDLRTADALYVCNALRGWQAVTLKTPDRATKQPAA